MEAKKSFTEASTSGSRDQMEPKGYFYANYLSRDMHEATTGH